MGLTTCRQNHHLTGLFGVLYTQGTYFVFSSHTKTLILWPSIWHDTTKPEAVLVAYHWANFWGAVSFRQVLTNGAASSKACDLELVLTSKLVPCTLPVNSRPSQKDNLSVGVKSYFIFTKKQTKYNKKKVTKDLFEVLLLRIFKKFRNEEDKQLCSRTDFEVKVIILYDE